MVFFPPIKSMVNDDFSEPPRCADSKNPISFFAEFGVRVHSEAQRSVSVGFLGARQWSPLSWGGPSQKSLSTPPPPEAKAQLPRLVTWHQ